MFPPKTASDVGQLCPRRSTESGYAIHFAVAAFSVFYVSNGHRCGIHLWPQNIFFTVNERAQTQQALPRDRMAGRDGALLQRLFGDRYLGRRADNTRRAQSPSRSAIVHTT
jgi:hypothetical protein